MVICQNEQTSGTARHVGVKDSQIAYDGCNNHQYAAPAAYILYENGSIANALTGQICGPQIPAKPPPAQYK